MSGRWSGLGAALLALALDQGVKLWLLHGLGMERGEVIALAPFFDLTLAYNPGISYSLLPASSDAQRWLLAAVTMAATAALAVWLWRSTRRLTSLALGLLVGGALGNLFDRLAYGAVVDFAHFHIAGFSWYVFNIADCAIVVGVALLLYDSGVKGGGDKVSP